MSKDTITVNMNVNDIPIVVEALKKANKEIERLKKREQECIDHYLVQCKYASEMEDKYITASNIIKEVREKIKEFCWDYDYETYSNMTSNEVKELVEILDKALD